LSFDLEAERMAEPKNESWLELGIAEIDRLLATEQQPPKKQGVA